MIKGTAANRGTRGLLQRHGYRNLRYVYNNWKYARHFLGVGGVYIEEGDDYYRVQCAEINLDVKLYTYNTLEEHLTFLSELNDNLRQDWIERCST